MKKDIKNIKQIQNMLQELQNEIRSAYKAEITGIFGSYVRGDQKEKSDLDVLVNFYEGATIFDFIALADYLEEKLDLKVDIVSERAVREETKEEIYKELLQL